MCPKLFDTHCHLNFKRLLPKFDHILSQARKAKVHWLLIPGIDLATSHTAIQLAQKKTNIWAAVGLHPHYMIDLMHKTQTEQTQIWQSLTQLAHQPSVKAIGEIGLDRHLYYKVKHEHHQLSDQFWQTQVEWFNRQLQLATQLDLPVIIHNRSASSQLLSLLQTQTSLPNKLIFHCCEPNIQLLQFVLIQPDRYIGVDGDVTYHLHKQQFIAQVPLERLLLETDSPYLLPEPLRSAKQYPNHPANLPLIAQAVAEIKHLSYQQVVSQTSQNAQQVFGLDN